MHAAAIVARFRPDPTYYPSPTMAMQAPPEQLAYVGCLVVMAAIAVVVYEKVGLAILRRPGSTSMSCGRSPS